jgi:hypothetical protein
METITPYGDYTLVPAADLARLEALAERLGLHPEALDDAVHDVCDRAAAHLADDDEDTFAEDDEDEEHRDGIWDEVSGIGSEVNNAGLTAQLAFLLADDSADHVATLLHNLTARTPTRRR